MWETIVRLNDEEARRMARDTESNWSNAADPGGNDHHQVRDEMQMSINSNEWVSFEQTWHLYSDGKGWNRWIRAFAASTQCRNEQLKDEWAKEHCQIIATYPRTDTQQAELRMQQDDQNACTQKVFLDVTQAIKGFQDVHTKLMENILEQ